MKTEEKYNGWTNYETWRFNLESVDHDSHGEQVRQGVYGAVWQLADELEQYAGDWIDQFCDDDFTTTWAGVALSRVDYHEIAQHIWDEHAEE